MLCVSFVLMFSSFGFSASSYILQYLEVLRDILARQCVASNNPLFAHYLFEAIGCASRIAASQGLQSTVESTLMPTLTPIVANGEHDFNPYALQVKDVFSTFLLCPNSFLFLR